jgi:hypothetical protein
MLWWHFTISVRGQKNGIITLIRDYNYGISMVQFGLQKYISVHERNYTTLENTKHNVAVWGVSPPV